MSESLSAEAGMGLGAGVRAGLWELGGGLREPPVPRPRAARARAGVGLGPSPTLPHPHQLHSPETSRHGHTGL